MNHPSDADSAPLPQSRPPVLAPELVSVLASPAKLQVLAVLDECGPMAAASIRGACDVGISRAALYPHLQMLKTAGLIEVVSRRQIRGTAEETLALTEISKRAAWADVLRFLHALPYPSTGEH